MSRRQTERSRRGVKKISPATTMLLNSVPVMLMASATHAATKAAPRRVFKSSMGMPESVSCTYRGRHRQVTTETTVEARMDTMTQSSTAASREKNSAARVTGIA